MRAAVLHAFGQAPRWQEFPPPVPQDGEELIEVRAAPLNNIDRVRADGSHYSVRTGEYASGGLPAVPGVIGPAASGCCPFHRPSAPRCHSSRNPSTHTPPDKTLHGFASAGTFSGKQWKHSPSRSDIATDNGTDSAG